MTEISQGKTTSGPGNQLALVLDVDISKTWGHPTEDQFLDRFVKQGRGIVDAFLQFGDHYFDWLEQKSAPSIAEKQKAYFATYHWPECAKAFMILWRDVLFELQKGRILLQLEAIDAEELNRLFADSKDTIQNAVGEVTTFLDESLRKARSKKGGIDQKMNRFRLQENPWPVYRQQLLDLRAQLDSLLTSYEDLGKTADAFQRIRTALYETIDKCSNELSQHRSTAQQVIDSILHNAEAKPGKVANLLEETEAQIQLGNHLYIFTETTERNLTPLKEKLQVPVATEGGLILYKEINFQKSTRQWLDSEIIPLLYEIWELTELNANGLKMSLLNIRNRALVLASENKDGKQLEFDRKDLVYPIQSFIRKSDGIEQDLNKLRHMVDTRLGQNFKLSRI